MDGHFGSSRDVSNRRTLGILLDGRGDLLSLQTYPGRFAEPYGSSKTVAELHGLRAGRRSDLTVQEHSVSGVESRTWIHTYGKINRSGGDWNVVSNFKTTVTFQLHPLYAKRLYNYA